MTFPPHCRYSVDAAWSWKRLDGWKMVNRVASTVPVSVCAVCLAKCTQSPICDSFNYRPDDKTCQLNTYESSVETSILMQSPPTGPFRRRPLIGQRPRPLSGDHIHQALIHIPKCDLRCCWQDVPAQHTRHSAHRQLDRYRRRRRLGLVESDLCRRPVDDCDVVFSLVSNISVNF